MTKAARKQTALTVVLVGGLTFTPTALFAQGTSMLTVPVPVAVQSSDTLSTFQMPVTGDPPAGAIILQSYDGIDFRGSNCGCLPPDTNAAVGNNFVVETVNVQIRIFDKATGNILLNEPLATFFGAPTGGDPYVIYDDRADRWYVSAFDNNDTGLFLAVSNDGNPLDGFLPTYHLTNVGGFPDYEKPGFNNDAIFISFNNFGPGGGTALQSPRLTRRQLCPER
jgi:hypothetical protein